FPPYISTFRKIIQDANDSTFNPSILIGGLISKAVNYMLPVVTDAVSPEPLPYTIGSSNTQKTEATDWHFIIGPNATLELQNQTILKFRKDVNFRVDGTAIFPQGESKIVYFTSVNDDSIGGKLVGSSGTPAPGDWGILRFNHDNTITNGFFSNGTEIYFNQLTAATAFNNNTVVQFSENDLHLFAAVYPCLMEISQNLLSNGRTAIFMETLNPFHGPCSPKIYENNIIGHSYYPIRMINTCNPDFLTGGDNSVENVNYPAIAVSGTIQPNIEVTWSKIEELSYVILKDDFQLSRGEDFDGIATKVEYDVLIDTNPKKFWETNTLINGTLNPNTRLTDVNNYTIIANNSTSVTVIVPQGAKGLDEYAMPIGGDTYSITTYDSSLVIGQGNVIKFDLHKNLFVSGNLELMGTSAHPIVFTSIRDDDFGSIIEPGHPDAARGDWNNITLYNNINLIENCIFRLGRSIILESCSPHIKNNIISGFSGNAIHCVARTAPSNPDILNNQISCNTIGIFCETRPEFGVNQCNPRITSNDFYRNDEYAVANSKQTLDIDAQKNWWGHETGPWGTQPVCSTGQGDAITEHVIACGVDDNGEKRYYENSVFSVDNESPFLQNINPPPNTMTASVATDISFDLIDTGAGLDLDTFDVQVDHSDGRRPIYVVKDGIVQNDFDSGIPFDVDILTIPNGIQFIYNPAQNFTLDSKICVIISVEDKAFCPNILTEFYSEFCFTPGVFQGLSDGRVEPMCGNTDTEFHYSVSFYDDTLLAPMSTDLYIDGNTFAMTLETGNPAGGVYGYTTTLSSGYHDFYYGFVTGDGLTLRLPASAPTTFPGPFVASEYETIAWPMFMQNQFHNAHSYVEGPAKSVQVDWSFTANGDFLASPIVDLNNNVYCASFEDGKIYKFDS
ncbi:hypothetical protein KKB18_06375, partial [bacterium]|nr:hypothetical protein [bacterium]